jgi:hypothetical protein
MEKTFLFLLKYLAGTMVPEKGMFCFILKPSFSKFFWKILNIILVV